MKFELRAQATGTRARAATLTTLHGVIETPIFMPVGTRGTVRSQTLAQLEELGNPIILANTYHLMVRPGIEVFERLGGLHKWMGWKGSILTDSGGFQVFSLAHARVMSEEGAQFRVGTDGPRLMLTPERAIAMQRAIGSDIMMVLDECVPSTCSHEQARAAMELTHRWARRSLAARGDSPQALFAIVQGACFEDLRRASADHLTSIDGFDGYAIGGLAVGEERTRREDVTELTAERLPADRPRYLMGVGTPLDLLEAVHRGVDMFDCILPTAWAQQGVVFTSRGKIDLRRGSYKLAEQPLDAACDCAACTVYTRSYLHHLVRSKEPLGWQLLSFHNLRFYNRLMADIRAAIAEDRFAALYRERREALAQSDLDNPPVPPPRKPVRPAIRGRYTIHDSPQGFSSIQHVDSGEIMHSINHPDDEAERVYVAQSAGIAAALAAERAADAAGAIAADGDATGHRTQRAADAAGRSRPLVVWDVGLGAAHNAMALVRALDRTPDHGPIELVSFEHDLDALRLALSDQKRFAHVRHAGPHLLLHAGVYRRPSLTWTLCEGDFLDTFPAQPAPDVVFYDPFSPKVDHPMWSLATFRRLFAHFERPAELFTYSASTAVRSALLAAGFHVARGVGSGPKSETTVALTGVAAADFGRHALLGREWLDRRRRSSARFGADIPPEHHALVEESIAGHAQFR